MGDRLRAGKSSRYRYVTSHLGQLSLLSLTPHHTLSPLVSMAPRS